MTFERRVGALYLALLLTGDTAPELEDGREVLSVAFQQAPRVPVDDLVIRAARRDEPNASLELAIAIRRKPQIVRSNADTQKLIVECLRALLSAPNDGREHRLALVVAGRQPHAEQLAELASLARKQMNAPAFFDLLRTRKKFGQQLVRRLDHFEALVKNALRVLSIPDPNGTDVRLGACQAR